MKLPRAFSWQGIKSKLAKPTVRTLVILTGFLIIFFVIYLPFMKGQKQQVQTTLIPTAPLASHNPAKVTTKATLITVPGHQVSKAPSIETAPKTTTGGTAAAKTNEANYIKLTKASFGNPVQGKVLRGTSKGLIWWEVLADYRQHVGEDIAAPKGTHVLASQGGTVTELGIDPIYGHVVVITHADGWKTVYGQLANIEVKLNSNVQKGTQLGEVGSPEGGEENLAAHLHYEILQENSDEHFQVRN